MELRAKTVVMVATTPVTEVPQDIMFVRWVVL